MKKIVLAAAFVALSSSPAFAAGNTDTDQGTAVATVVAPITVTHVAEASLNFGVFTAGSGGTVTVDAAGTGTAGADVTFMSDSTNSADQFTVTGDPGRSFTIETTDSTVESGTDSMDFTTEASAATGLLDTAGEASFSVGGVLTVADGKPAGDYSGSYDVTVTYE